MLYVSIGSLVDGVVGIGDLVWLFCELLREGH